MVVGRAAGRCAKGRVCVPPWPVRRELLQAIGRQCLVGTTGCRTTALGDAIAAPWMESGRTLMQMEEESEEVFVAVRRLRPGKKG